MHRIWTSLVWAGAVLGLASLALADGVMLNGVSPRSIGRGGTNLGFADNGAMLYDNPAAMVNLRGEGLLDVGADMLLGDYHYSNPFNNSAADNSLFPLPQISLVRKTDDGQWAYGLGLFVPAGFAETYDLQNPLFGPQRYKSVGSLMKVLPGAAWKATDRLSVGATFGVGVSHGELEGPYFLQGPSPFRGTPTLFDLQATGATFCWSAGLQYQLTDATTLGVTYQSESRFQLHGNTAVTIPGFGASAYDTRADVTWPSSLGLGVRHELCPHRILAVDVIWFNWSQAFDDFGIHLGNPTTPGFPTLVEQFPLNWRDTVSVRLGYEQALGGGHTVRCGYVYHRNPVPEGTLTPFIQAIPEHCFSVGYGREWQLWSADVSYVFAFGEEQTVGTSDFVGGDFDQSTHRTQVHCIAVSLMRRF